VDTPWIAQTVSSRDRAAPNLAASFGHDDLEHL